MRDLNLNEFASELRERLIDQGVELPKSLVRQMTKAFFEHAEKTGESSNSRFLIPNRGLTQVYPKWDEKALCLELAEGKNVLTAEYLNRIGKFQKKAARHYRKRMGLTANVEL
jgi:predicted transcriptional regulator